MTTTLAPRPPAVAERGRIGLTLSDYKELIRRPLLALPAELRQDALALWVCHKHLAGLTSAMPIAGAVSVWIDRHGLRPDDAADILRDMLAPQRMGKFSFASDLMTTLAGMANERINKRRQEAELARMRAEDALAREQAAAPEEVQRLMAELIGSIGI